MPNETAEDDFLGDLAGNTDPFTPQDNDDLFPEEKETVVETEKPVPFAKDEKVQRYIERTIEKRLKDYKPSAQETFVKEVTQGGGSERLTKALAAYAGNDRPETKAIFDEMQAAFSDLKGEAKREAIQEFLASQQESTQQEERDLEEAFDELAEGREEIEESIGRDLTERQWKAYKNFLSDSEPRGGYQEYPDFVKTFDNFKKVVQASRPSNAQAKALASRGMERSSSNSDTVQAPKRDGTKSLWQMLGQ